MSMATNKLMSNVYDVTSAASPPNFCVTTAAAVAVGHIIHSIPASIITRPVT